MSATKAAAPRRVLIAGVGYRNLSDLSLGPVAIDRWKQESWPDGVELDDLSYGPIGVMHNLDDRVPYDKMVFVAGIKRDRTPGAVYCYRWTHELPDAEDIQARIGEAVTGVISLDNLLIIATYFNKLPSDVVLVEIEPVNESWGEQFTAAVEEAIPLVYEQVRRHVEVS